jgi:hypothetical protein
MPEGSSSATFSRRPGLVHAGLVPMDRSEIDTVFVREEPTRVDRGGLRPFGHADALAGELFGLCDAGLAADVDRRMAKHARREHRQRDEARVVLRGECRDLGERHLGDVEFAVHEEAVEHFLDRQPQRVEIDARDRYRSVDQVAHVVVLADGEREREFRHGGGRCRPQSTLTPVDFTILPYFS